MSDEGQVLRPEVAELMRQLEDLPFRNAIITGMLMAQPGIIAEDGTFRQVPLEPDLDLALRAVFRAWMAKDKAYDDPC